MLVLRNSIFDTINFPRISNYEETRTKMREFDNEYRLSVVLPGVNKDDFKIELKRGKILISYEERQETNREFSYRSFAEQWTLPQDIEKSQISASYKDGILSVVLPKKPENVQIIQIQ